MSFRGQTVLTRLRKVLLLLIFLYCFLVSIKCLSGGFKMLGEDFGRQLISTTSNPFVGLLIGILVTSIIQSSSGTTSVAVALVASGQVTVANAIPIVMGANIGTTITNTLVSLGHIRKRDEFRRAMSAAVVHDVFNILCVAIFLTLELTTGFLEISATWLADNFAHLGGLDYVSPLKTITSPVAKFLGKQAEYLLGLQTGAIVLIVVTLGTLFTALIGMVRIMRSATLTRFELLFDKYVGRYPISALFLGILVTGIIQSSSITTSLLVPMVGAGVLTVRQVYPVTLGANIGTTVTAMLAALASKNIAALTIAFVHLLFNLCGTTLFFFIPWMENIPIMTADALAKFFAKARYYAIIFILIIFFVIPGFLLFLHEMFWR